MLKFGPKIRPLVLLAAWHKTGSQQIFHHLNVALNHTIDCTLTA